MYLNKIKFIKSLLIFLLFICLHKAYAVIDDKKISFQPPVNEIIVLDICHPKGTCAGSAVNLHVGTDYSPEPNRYDETPVYAVNFGVLNQYIDFNQDVGCNSLSCTMGNVIVVEHVLTTGEKRLSLYAHLERKNSIDNRVSKNQEIGVIGCSGSSRMKWCSASGRNKHVHFEIKKPDLGFSDLWPFGYMNQTEANQLRLSAEGQLEIKKAIDRAFTKVETLQEQKVRILIPFFSNTDQPTVENYKVFGIEGEQLYASISLTPLKEKTFTQIGVGGTIYVDNNKFQDIFINPKEYFFANETKSLTGNKILSENDYEFYAYSEQFGRGYPLKISILEKNSKIVDNDSREGFSKDEVKDEINDFLEVPGYYLSAYLFLAQPKTIKYAKWTPKLNPGKYEIFIHVPNMSTATAVRYKIYSFGKSNSQLILSDPINHNDNNDKWVKITATNQSSWEFNEEGFVGLSMGNTDSKDDGGNNQIPEGQLVGIDAVKFIYVGGSANSDIQIESLNKEKGDFLITNTAPDNSYLILINGKEIQGQQSSDSITFNLYQATDTNFSSLKQSIRVELFDADKQKVYSDYFPFKDILPFEWYTPPIMKLWKEGLLQSNEGDFFKPHEPCEKDNNLFCPGEPIKRIEAIMKALSAFPDKFQNTLADFKQGKQPLKLFVDVINPDSEYFPYVYTAKKENLMGGYSDNTFKPEQFITRAEMAKLICTVTYDPEACIATGEPDKTAIAAILPQTATLDEPTIFLVFGRQLPEALSIFIEECSDMIELGGNADKRRFQCTPSGTTGNKQGFIEDPATGEQLYSFEIEVQAPACTPTVSSITPTTATLDKETTFTVQGQCLPETTTFWIAECAGMTVLGGDEQQRRFQCTPSYTSGIKEGVVKEQAGGIVLNNFSVTVETSAPVCTPAVSSVTPNTATLDQATTFTVQGQCLPETTAFWIAECEGMTVLGGDEQQRQFQCTPSYTSGIKEGVVKDQAGGTVLDNFSVTVETSTPVCTPAVSSVTPNTATLDQATIFTVQGQCLPETTAFWIAECAGMTALGGDEQQRRFQCTPSYSSGFKQGVVKEQSNGTELKSFSITVELPDTSPGASCGYNKIYDCAERCFDADDIDDWIGNGYCDDGRYDAVLTCSAFDNDGGDCDSSSGSCTPSVSSVSPLTATFNRLTTFTVQGQCLPETTAFWIGECENLISQGGDDEKRWFECTPSHTLGYKDGVVKDQSGGTVLRNFTVNVQ